MIPFRFYYKKALIFSIFGFFVIIIIINLWHSKSVSEKESSSGLVDEDFSYQYPKSNKLFDKPQLSHRKTVDREILTEMHETLMNITKEKSCPACLGIDLCEDVNSGFLSITSSEKSEHPFSVSFKGNIGVEHPVLLQVPDNSLFEKVENVLCGGNPCNIKSSSSIWPYITSVKAITPAHITKFLKQLGGNPITNPLMICSSSLSVSVLESAFTTESVSAGSGVPTPADKMNLLTAIGVAPGYAVQKMAQSLQLSPGIVPNIGVCGRTWVTADEDLTPLTRLLQEEWPVRAALGAQLLSIVEDLLEGSEEWLAVMTVWSPEYLSVTSDGELLITDARFAAIIDRGSLEAPTNSAEEIYDTLGEICNRECFERRFSSISSVSPSAVDTIPQNKRPGFRAPSSVTSSYNEVIPDEELKHAGIESPLHSCAHEDLFAHLMYASVCSHILSDDPQLQDFVLMEDIPARNRPFKGLLYDPPAEVSSVSSLLRSCVEETTEGGRLKAVEELKDLLNQYGGLDEEDYDQRDEVL